jgi:hypothetical protein
MNAITLHDLKDKKALHLHEVESLVAEGRLRGATFYACDFTTTVDDASLAGRKKLNQENVFILLFEFNDGVDRASYEGYLSQINNILPRTFKTPQAVMSNAHKLDLKTYVVDATFWTASHFDLYKKQAEMVRGKAK